MQVSKPWLALQGGSILKLQILGYTHLSQEGVQVPLSIKALALLTFLTLEERPHHREHLADLLWRSPHALRNLRVELSQLRKILPEAIPAGTPMVGLTLRTDLDDWLEDGASLNESNLGTWLSVATGLPLSGLEDVGTPRFQGWLEQRRWSVQRQIERALSGAYAAFEGNNLGGAAQQVMTTLRSLGMEYQPQVAIPLLSDAPFERVTLRRTLQGILQRARVSPQLILLQGRSGAGRRDLLAQSLAHTDWKLVQMQVSPHLEAQRASFLHQIMPLLGLEAQSELRMLLTRPALSLTDLIRAWSLLAASEQPVVVAYHHVAQVPAWLVDSWQFAMNLPASLVLVVFGSPLGNESELRQALAPLDQERLHTLELEPLTVCEISQVLQRRQPSLPPAEVQAQATLLLQQSAGWDFHARELLSLPTPRLRERLSPGVQVRDRLLSELGELTPAQEATLLKLAPLHHPLDPQITRHLLGQGANEGLAQLEHLGLLQPYAPEETVRLPELELLPPVFGDQLIFSHEALRAALTSTLPTSELRVIHAELARYYQASGPELARYYAALGSLDELPEVPAEVDQVAANILTAPRQDCDSPARSQLRTVNDYLLSRQGGQLVITRAGPQMHSPLLRLRWPQVKAGHWRLVVRLDAFWHESMLNTQPQYALGVRVGRQEQTCYVPHPAMHSPASYSPASSGRSLMERLPLGQWCTLHGKGLSGKPELSVQAAGIALTVAEWEWGEQKLWPPPN